MNETETSSRDVLMLVGAAIAAVAVAAVLALATSLSNGGVWGQRDLAIGGVVLALGIAVIAWSAADMRRRGHHIMAPHPRPATSSRGGHSRAKTTFRERCTQIQRVR